MKRTVKQHENIYIHIKKSTLKVIGSIMVVLGFFSFIISYAWIYINVLAEHLPEEMLSGLEISVIMLGLFSGIGLGAYGLMTFLLYIGISED